MEDLQTREFTCHNLRRGTFISCTLTQATAAEKEKARTTCTVIPKRPRVNLNPKVKDISEFNSKNEMTIISETQSQSNFVDISQKTKREKRKAVTPANPGKSREACKMITSIRNVKK